MLVSLTQRRAATLCRSPAPAIARRAAASDSHSGADVWGCATSLTGPPSVPSTLTIEGGSSTSRASRRPQLAVHAVDRGRGGLRAHVVHAQKAPAASCQPGPERPPRRALKGRGSGRRRGRAIRGDETLIWIPVVLAPARIGEQTPSRACSQARMSTSSSRSPPRESQPAPTTPARPGHQPPTDLGTHPDPARSPSSTAPDA
jgi:hypothetical protein